MESTWAGVAALVGWRRALLSEAPFVAQLPAPGFAPFSLFWGWFVLGLLAGVLSGSS